MMNIFNKFLLRFKSVKVYNGECYIYLKDGSIIQGNKLICDDTKKDSKELICYSNNSIYSIPYDNHSYREYIINKIEDKLIDGYI